MELLRIEEIAAVEEEGRLVHVLEDGWQIQVAEFVPFGEQDDSVGVAGRCLG